MIKARFEKGQVIMQENSQIECVYFICKGDVMFLRKLEIMGEFSNGSFFGELACFDVPSLYTVL